MKTACDGEKGTSFRTDANWSVTKTMHRWQAGTPEEKEQAWVGGHINQILL